MTRHSTHNHVALALAAVITVATVLPARAEVYDFHTTYATASGACKSGKTITWSPTGITGPGFECTLGDSTPAGTGLVSYQGSCVVDGKQVSDQVAFDLGNNVEHFSLAIPGREWMSMYPCTPVDGLEGTN